MQADHQIRLMKRLVDGLGGWVTYYQSCGLGRHYTEHLFYEHIEAIVKGRDWKVMAQAKFVSPTGRAGAPDTIDFVFYRRTHLRTPAGLLFVEVKYLRGDAPSQDLAYLKQDIDKLRATDVQALQAPNTFQGCGDPVKFLLIVCQAEGLDKTLALKARKNQSVQTMLKRANTRDGRGYYKARQQPHLKPAVHWHVWAIAEPQWP